MVERETFAFFLPYRSTCGTRCQVMVTKTQVMVSKRNVKCLEDGLGVHL